MIAASSVTLSVKHVSNDLAQRLRDRAERNHRSLQGELLAILHEATRGSSVRELSEIARRIGLKGPSESAALVRQDRDARSR